MNIEGKTVARVLTRHNRTTLVMTDGTVVEVGNPLNVSTMPKCLITDREEDTTNFPFGYITNKRLNPHAFAYLCLAPIAYMDHGTHQSWYFMDERDLYEVRRLVSHEYSDEILQSLYTLLTGETNEPTN